MWLTSVHTGFHASPQRDLSSHQIEHKVIFDIITYEDMNVVTIYSNSQKLHNINKIARKLHNNLYNINQ